MESMATDDSEQLTQADHDRLALLERLAMTPSQRVRTNAAMYAVWRQGQLNPGTIPRAPRPSSIIDHDDQLVDPPNVVQPWVRQWSFS